MLELLRRVTAWIPLRLKDARLRQARRPHLALPRVFCRYNSAYGEQRQEENELGKTHAWDRFFVSTRAWHCSMWSHATAQPILRVIRYLPCNRAPSRHCTLFRARAYSRRIKLTRSLDHPRPPTTSVGPAALATYAQCRSQEALRQAHGKEVAASLPGVFAREIWVERSAFFEFRRPRVGLTGAALGYKAMVVFRKEKSPTLNWVHVSVESVRYWYVTITHPDNACLVENPSPHPTRFTSSGSRLPNTQSTVYLTAATSCLQATRTQTAAALKSTTLGARQLSDEP